MGMGDRAFASATELSDEIRHRLIACVELLDFYLDAEGADLKCSNHARTSVNEIQV